MKLLLLAAAAVSSHPQQGEWPLTRAERTAFAETSRYEDVIDFVQALQRREAPISLQYIGASTEGRRMPLVVCSDPMVTTGTEAHRSGKVVVYVQGNIHAGEVEGKEAAQILLRRVAQDRRLLKNLILVVNPIYNIDGNEKFGPVVRNRPEQIGPEMVGVRANGQGLDLNRDCIKAESPEMRGVLDHVYGQWDPDVILDLHTTDGTRHGYDLTYSPPLNPNTDPGVMRFVRDQMLPALRKEMPRRGGFSMFDYGNVENRRGSQGFYTFGQEGRYVTNYAGLRNRIGILSEAATYIPFQDRVKATDHFVMGCLELLARRAKDVRRAIDVADQAALPPVLGVRFDFESRGEESVMVEPRTPGQANPVGRPKELRPVRMPIFDRFKVARGAAVPTAYVLHAEESKAVELLLRHGIVVEKVTEDWAGPGERFELTEVVVAGSPFQGHRLIRLEGTASPSTVRVPKGSFLVRTRQALGRLAFHLLEPESLDGVAAWGFLVTMPKVGEDFAITKVRAPISAAAERMGGSRPSLAAMSG